MILNDEDLNRRIPFAYLMLFKDGNRIDLTLFPVNDSDYLIKRPSQKEFNDHCNEFWWISTYVAKDLIRNEITYAKAMMDAPVRKMFMKMLEWYIGTQTGFKVSFGKDGRFIKEKIRSLWSYTGRFLKLILICKKRIWELIYHNCLIYFSKNWIHKCNFIPLVYGHFLFSKIRIKKE